MPTRKKRTMKRPKKKGTGKKIYNQVGCAKRNMKQKGGSAMGTMHAGSLQEGGAPVLFSKTMYPYESTGGAANPTDTRQTQMGGSRRKKYSRKYYKQSGGMAYGIFSRMENHANQPVNDKYTDSNPFRI